MRLYSAGILILLMGASCAHSVRDGVTRDASLDGASNEKDGSGNATGGGGDAGDASAGESRDAASDVRDSGEAFASDGAVNTVAGAVAYYGVPVAGAQIFIQGRTSMTDAKGRFVMSGVIPPYDATVVFEQYHSMLRIEGVSRLDPLLNCTSCPIPTAMIRTAHVSGTIAPPDAPYPGEGGVSSVADTVYTSVELDGATRAPYWFDANASAQTDVPLYRGPQVWTSQQPFTSNEFSQEVRWIGPATTTGRVRVTLTSTDSPRCADHLIGTIESAIRVTDGATVNLKLQAEPVLEQIVAATVTGPSAFYPPHIESSPNGSWVDVQVGLYSGPCLASGSRVPRFIGDRAFAFSDAGSGGPGYVTANSSVVSTLLSDYDASVILALRDVTRVEAEGDAYRLLPDVPGYHTVALTVGGWDMQLLTMNQLVQAPKDVPRDAGAPFIVNSVRTRSGSIDDVTSPIPVPHPAVEYDTMGYTAAGRH